MDETNLKQIETFLSTYENILKNIFITAEKQHGKGILIVDINNNNKGNCDKNIYHLHIQIIFGNNPKICYVRKN